MIAGIVEAYKAWAGAWILDYAYKIADAVITTMAPGGILTETQCEDASGLDTCNADQRMYKGIFMRSLRYLVDVLPANSSRHQGYTSWIRQQALSVLSNSSCNPQSEECYIVYKDGPCQSAGTLGPVFTSNWAARKFNYSSPMEQTQALDLLNSAIFPRASCTGAGCSYDPVLPPPRPHKASCKPNPCPPGHQCCFSYDAYSCCDPGQKCDTGFCTDAPTKAPTAAPAGHKLK